MSINMKMLPKVLQPREKVILEGINSLTDAELLSLILRTGYKGNNAIILANEILQHIGGIQNIGSYNIEQLKKFKGVGNSKATEIMVIVELQKRVIAGKIKDYTYLNNPKQIFNLYQARFIEEMQEKFIVIALNTKNALISEQILFVGTINKSLIHPREILGFLVENKAASFICLHNHPSGDVIPSLEDIEVTNKLIELGNLIGIPLLDHIIIGKKEYYSFKSEIEI
ncbi:RadC family protein [Mycoplasma sp. P36-A1]|uniref:RadC family protein n=1 Tax=Mycoplasma sp. P36-A1 TaxID=3252900 RepID=UPI003C2BBB99